LILHAGDSIAEAIDFSPEAIDGFEDLLIEALLIALMRHLTEDAIKEKQPLPPFTAFTPPLHPPNQHLRLPELF